MTERKKIRIRNQRRMNSKIEGKIRMEEDGWAAKFFAKKYVN
jgi:hypothetical protein